MKELKFLALLLMVTLVVGDNDIDEELSTPDQTEAENFDIGELTIQSSTVDEGRLYYNISNEFYDNAVAIAQDLIRRGDKQQVKNTMIKLVEHKRSNIAAFAYKMYEAGEKWAVRNLFPTPFRMVCNDSLISFMLNKNNIPIDLSRFEDHDGDKNVYGREAQATKPNYIWKLEPAFDGRDIYFKIRSHTDNWYLKLGTEMDSDGDYQAYASKNSDTERHQWMLQPVKYQWRTSFFLVNRAHYQTLKLGVSVYDGNHNVYSVGSDYYNYPESYSWRALVKNERKVCQ